MRRDEDYGATLRLTRIGGVGCSSQSLQGVPFEKIRIAIRLAEYSKSRINMYITFVKSSTKGLNRNPYYYYTSDIQMRDSPTTHRRHASQAKNHDSTEQHHQLTSLTPNSNLKPTITIVIPHSRLNPSINPITSSSKLPNTSNPSVSRKKPSTSSPWKAVLNFKKSKSQPRQ